MNLKNLVLPLACATLAAIGLGTPQQTAPQQELSLAAAIPEDVFLLSLGRHNPERAFIDAYWNEVWEAFKASGITEDLVNLAMGAADEDQRAVIEGLRERLEARITAVDWSGLVGGEVAFGERMPPLRFLPGKNPFLSPEYVVLFRPGPQADVDAIHGGLDALIEAILEEVHTLAGAELKLDRSQVGSLQLATLDLTQLAPEAPSMPVTLGRIGNVLFMSFGAGIQKDVVALINGSDDVRSILANERMRKALAQLPAPEDELFYFDMQNLRASLERLADEAFEAAGSSLASDRVLNSNANPEAVKLRREGLAVYEQGDYVEALRLHMASLEIDPADSTTLFNIACLKALQGEGDAALEWLEKAVEAGFHSPAKIGEDTDLRTLRGEPRFEAAVERARSLAAESSEVAVARALIDRLFATMGILDCSAAVVTTEGHSTITQSVALLAPGAENNPFYSVLASGEPIDDFARYLPRETTSFTVDGSLSLAALYDFVEESVLVTGPAGEQAWGRWVELQEQIDFDLRADLLSWIGASSVQASLAVDGAPGWILLMGVHDEGAAREGLDWALEIVPEELAELAAQIPPLAMLQPRIAPSAHPELEGFHEIALGMMPAPMVCGVHDGWLMMGSTQEALLLALHTAAGEHENVTANEALMAKALVPEGLVSSVSFTDHSGAAQEAAAILGAVTMAGGMVAAQVPDPEERKVVMELLRIAGKLGPVVGKIDFFDSSASLTSFDGQAWSSRKVTHYVPPSAAEESTGGQ